MDQFATDFIIQDNTTESRYEAHVDGEVAFVEYVMSKDGLILSHTEVPKSLRGHGVAQKLVRGILDRLRDEERTMVPLCPFVLSYVKRHPEYLDVVAEKYRRLVTRR